MPGRKRVRTTVRTYFAYSIFDRTCHGSVEAFGNGNQAKLIHPIMLLLPHQVADKNPTQHAPFHVIVDPYLLDGILAGKEMEIVHPVYGSANRSDCYQGSGKDQAFRFEFIFDDRHPGCAIPYPCIGQGKV